MKRTRGRHPGCPVEPKPEAHPVEPAPEAHYADPVPRVVSAELHGEVVALVYDFAKAADWIAWTLTLDREAPIDHAALLAPLALLWDVELEPGVPFVPAADEPDQRRAWEAIFRHGGMGVIVSRLYLAVRKDIEKNAAKLIEMHRKRTMGREPLFRVGHQGTVPAA